MVHEVRQCAQRTISSTWTWWDLTDPSRAHRPRRRSSARRRLDLEDVTALADALRTFIAQPELAKAKAEALRVAIARKFTIASMNSAILQLYYGALGRN